MMPRRQVAAICNRHGFYLGEYCQECEETQANCVFNTTKDKLYEFDYAFGAKTYEIRSKGQWNRFMKEHGLHDDIKQTTRQPSEYMKPVDNRKEHREDLKKTMIGIAREKGLMPKLKLRRTY